MHTVSGKSVILTGGAGDIAQVALKLFVEAGAKVMLVDLDENHLQAITDKFNASDVQYCVADVTSESDTASYVAATLQAFGKVDVLLANAGIVGPVAAVSEVDTQSFQQVLDINVTGVFLGLKHVFPVMASNGGGSIVITSSIMGVSGGPGLSAYAASKHAVVGLMRSCAKEGGAHNIRVNTVNPAPAEGRMMRSLEQGLSPDDPQAQY
ncbi:MAG: NAD(P)-dependent dehydrogenase (short-subunit alcohol dehydrogenase family), partial [Congregibacter sp.]